ncbi:MAG: SRPBCC family protein [Coriobacteriia bacterium]
MMGHAMQAHPPTSNGDSAQKHNLGKADRMLSAVIGVTALLRLGRWHGAGKAAAATSGIMLLTRAATGHSKVYDALGVSSASLGERAGIDLHASITVMRPREEIYEFLRDVTNLPLFMRHLISVEDLGGGVTHWMARGPRNIPVEWDAQLITEEPGECLAWRSLPDSQIEHAGSVHFEDAGDNGTGLLVRMRYRPKGLVAGFAIAKFMAPVAQAEVLEDLQRLKHVMEAGLDITTEGQAGGSDET